MFDEDEWAIWRYYLCRPEKGMSMEELRNYFPVLDKHDPDGTDNHCQGFREAAEVYLKYAEGKITESEVSSWESERNNKRSREVIDRAKEIGREKFKDRK